MLTELWVFCAEYWVVVVIKLKTRHTVLLYGLNSNTRPVYGNLSNEEPLDMSLTTTRVIVTLHKVMDGTRSITEDFFHKAPCFIKFICAMLVYHFHLMSYWMKDHLWRAPNCCPFKLLKVNNDIYKYSFYPRTIALWNNIPLSFTNIDNLDTFKSNALTFIRSD